MRLPRFVPPLAALGLALLVVPRSWRDEAGRPAAPPLSRLLGPAADLLAELEWIRFQRARLDGDEPAAWMHAERALDLAPGDARGWLLLSAHVGLDLASREGQPDADVRARHLAWAVELSREGAERSGDVASLAFHRGVLLLTHAEQDPDIAWPGGTLALWQGAAEAFEEAAAAGASGAAELGRSCRAAETRLEGG